MKVVVRVRVETPLYPTEDPAKVRASLGNLFPDLTITEEPDRLVGFGTTLDTFRDLVRNQKIRDTAREVLLRGRRGSSATFRLSKQAAFVGRVNFAEDAPLGDLTVTIEDDDLDAVIDWTAESTVGRRLTRPGRTEDR